MRRYNRLVHNNVSKKSSSNQQWATNWHFFKSDRITYLLLLFICNKLKRSSWSQNLILFSCGKKSCFWFREKKNVFSVSRKKRNMINFNAFLKKFEISVSRKKNCTKYTRKICDTANFRWFFRKQQWDLSALLIMGSSKQYSILIAQRSKNSTWIKTKSLEKK